jgi:hypothetical protein
MAEKDENALDKLMKLTKLMKEKKVKVSKKGPPRSANKWRSEDPKFTPKAEKKEGTVNAGGMQVDPSVAAQYAAWRKDKEAEQADRRKQAERKAQRQRESRPPDY